MKIADWLKEYISYDPETGTFSRLKGQNLGPIVSGMKSNGYRYIQIDGVRYLASHIACLYMTGHWPLNQMDHINRKSSDDRWANLREVTSSQNQVNRIVLRNTSGVRGVSWNKRKNKYRAYINLRGIERHLGYYDSLEEAALVRKKHETYLHGEFSPGETV